MSRFQPFRSLTRLLEGIRRGGWKEHDAAAGSKLKGLRVLAFLIVVFAIVNICVGYGLAIFLGHVRASASHAPQIVRQVAAAPRAPATPATKTVIVEPAPKPEAEKEEEEEEEPPKHSEDIPKDWLEKLAGEVEPNSFVEASIHVLKLEVGRYRDQLIAIDADVRRCEQTADVELIKTCLETLKTVNEDWLEMQGEAAGHLQDRQGDLGEFSEIGGDLESVLLEQAAQIETTCTNIELLDFETDVPAGCQRLITEISRLLDLCHELRDRMHDSLLAIMLSGDSLDSLDQRLLMDALTGAYSRTGLEKIIQQWWRDDPNRRRQVSIAMADLDGVGKINEKYGPLVGDRVIRSFGRLFTDLLRKDRGFDVACRLSGQCFVAFLGDTGPRNGTSAIERIRQTVEASSFIHADEEIKVTISCGVIEIQPDDTSASMIKRVKMATREAKKAGRNQSYLFDGESPTKVEPPEFSVKPREIRLEFDDDIDE